jgi:hypothetical protein
MRIHTMATDARLWKGEEDRKLRQRSKYHAVRDDVREH